MTTAKKVQIATQAGAWSLRASVSIQTFNVAHGQITALVNIARVTLIVLLLIATHGTEAAMTMLWTSTLQRINHAQ